MEAEDVDAVRRRRGDEPADEVVVDGSRADEEAAAQSEPERRFDSRLERTDPFPRALDAASHRGVEAAPARDFEIGKPRAVERVGDPELLGGRTASRERFLSEQPYCRVGQRRHAWEPSRAGALALSGAVQFARG